MEEARNIIYYSAVVGTIKKNNFAKGRTLFITSIFSRSEDQVKRRNHYGYTLLVRSGVN